MPNKVSLCANTLRSELPKKKPKRGGIYEFIGEHTVYSVYGKYYMAVAKDGGFVFVNLKTGRAHIDAAGMYLPVSFRRVPKGTCITLTTE